MVVLHDSSGMVFTCQENGALFGRDTPHFYMAPVKRIRYIVMLHNTETGEVEADNTYDTRAEALHRIHTILPGYVLHGIAEYTYED